MSMILNYLRVTDAELDCLMNDPPSVVAFLYKQPTRTAVSLDKAWHGIHFLLTGKSWEGKEPLKSVILGGAPIGDADVGYGPARGLASERVRIAASALDEIDEAKFRSRFNAKALSQNGIYPEIWDDGDTALDYLAHYFEEVRRTFREAAEAGEAMIIFMN